MNLHKHQLYLLEQHSESFKIWSAVIRINTWLWDWAQSSAVYSREII